MHDANRRTRFLDLLVHVVCLAPLVVLGVELAQGASALPNRLIMLRTGAFGMLFVVCSFACTPANRILGWRWAVRLRRPFGVYGFLYTLLHLLSYAILDNALDIELILRDLEERRAMSIGLIALFLLVPLAITSTRWWQRKLGRRWKMLHWLVYVAIPLSLLHYFWLERDVIDVPIAYAVVIAVLFILRVAPVRRLLTALRQRNQPRAEQQT
jgi:methionine sulfoxide reductase heme-binding subunit